jgi:hypothetical protein
LNGVRCESGFTDLAARCKSICADRDQPRKVWNSARSDIKNFDHGGQLRSFEVRKAK